MRFEPEDGGRRSTKAAEIRAHDYEGTVSSAKSQYGQEVAHTKARQRDRRWSQEVKKAHRAGAELPEEPNASIGGIRLL